MPKLLDLAELHKNDRFYVAYSFEFGKLLNRWFRGKSNSHTWFWAFPSEAVVKELEAKARLSVEGVPKSDSLSGIVRAPSLSMAQARCLPQTHRWTICPPVITIIGFLLNGESHESSRAGWLQKYF